MSRRSFTTVMISLIALTNVSAALIDRVAITVGNRVITELRLDEELRVTALLNHQSIVRDLAARRAAADRLIQRMLIEREMQSNHYPEPTEMEVGLYVDEVRKSLFGQSAGDSQLAAYQLTEPVLREHLASQLMLMKFIEFRFRPEAEVSDAEIQDYYNREIASAAQSHRGSAPSFKNSEDTIRLALTEQHIDASLGQWIEETRKQLSIIYQDKSLQ